MMMVALLHDDNDGDDGRATTITIAKMMVVMTTLTMIKKERKARLMKIAMVIARKEIRIPPTKQMKCSAVTTCNGMRPKNVVGTK